MFNISKNIFALYSLVVLSFFVSLCEAKFYRTKKSGFWKDATVWECADDTTFLIGLNNATFSPDLNSETIYIQSNHIITIDHSLNLDETIVEKNATLLLGNFSGTLLSISDGPGTDLLVEGTIEDSAPLSVIWQNASATWALGDNGTMIRTRSTSAVLWRDHYEGGMSTIPANSSWVLRKQGNDNPSLSSINSYYGNLKIENKTTAFWDANTIGSKITGITSAPVIKGSLEIGTSSLNGIKFYSQNSSTNLIVINSNLLIAPGSEFNLEDALSNKGASGIELRGDLIVDGRLSYGNFDADDNNRMLKFSDNKIQTISGNGILDIYNLIIDKSTGTLIINRNIAIDNKLILLNGELNLNKNTLSIINSNPNAIARFNGWIISEEKTFLSTINWVIGSSIGKFEFPFGKNNTNYFPIIINQTSGDLGELSISTYGTAISNLPYPYQPIVVENLTLYNENYGLSMVDRFWYITTTGTISNSFISFSYNEEESITGNGNLLAINYNSFSNLWELPNCCQSFDSINKKVTAPMIMSQTVWAIAEERIPLWWNELPNVSKQQESAFPFFFYPNPFRDNLYLNYFSEYEETLHIEILTAQGSTIEKYDYSVIKGSNDLEIIVSQNLIPGLYYIRVTSHQGIYYRKIIQEKK